VWIGVDGNVNADDCVEMSSIWTVMMIFRIHKFDIIVPIQLILLIIDFVIECGCKMVKRENEVRKSEVRNLMDHN
jgi:hypothetical protein